ncbi:MAG: hypothetical protein WCP85_14915 [Mariniphaga sp.]
MKKTLLIALMVCSLFPLIAQENIPKKPRVYQAWIKLHNNDNPVQGLFYQVSDSSIFLTGKMDTSVIHEYNFRNIDLLKLRRTKSVKRGLITGSVIGLGAGVISSLNWVGEYGFMSGAIAVYVGFGFGMVGAGVGALSGTIKDRIPIKGNFGNFEKYRGSLKDYSFKNEQGIPEKKFIHRFYAGFTMGPSFASDGFAPLVPALEYKQMEMTGTGSRTNIGYRFSKRLGVNFSQRTSQYSLVGTSQTEDFWSFDAFSIGPVVTLPVSEKFRFEFLPSVGYAKAYLMLGNEETTSGNGIGIGFAGNLVYDFSKRWLLSAGIGYLTSNQVYSGSLKSKPSDLDLGFGVAYKFGKQSL